MTETCWVTDDEADDSPPASGSSSGQKVYFFFSLPFPLFPPSFLFLGKENPQIQNAYPPYPILRKCEKGRREEETCSQKRRQRGRSRRGRGKEEGKDKEGQWKGWRESEKGSIWRGAKEHYGLFCQEIGGVVEKLHVKLFFFLEKSWLGF